MESLLYEVLEAGGGAVLGFWLGVLAMALLRAGGTNPPPPLYFSKN